MGGLYSGVGVVISRYFGEGNDEKVKKSIGTAVTFGLVSGIILTIIGILFTPRILIFMGTPNDVFKDSLMYIRTYFFWNNFYCYV